MSNISYIVDRVKSRLKFINGLTKTSNSVLGVEATKLKDNKLTFAVELKVPSKKSVKDRFNRSDFSCDKGDTEFWITTDLSQYYNDDETDEVLKLLNKELKSSTSDFLTETNNNETISQKLLNLFEEDSFIGPINHVVSELKSRGSKGSVKVAYIISSYRTGWDVETVQPKDFISKKVKPNGIYLENGSTPLLINMVNLSSSEKLAINNKLKALIDTLNQNLRIESDSRDREDLEDRITLLSSLKI